jgi:hypothetical protein
MTSSTNPGTLPDVIDPSRPLDGWEVKDAIAELTAAVGDSSWFTTIMERNERTRQCYWEGKNNTGRKKDKTDKPAQPWNGAADHEVHLTEEILRDRQAMFLTALSRGALSVLPQNADDAARSARMKQVLRYYLTTAMGSNFMTMGLRAGNWADRVGHSITYVHWKEERGAEKRVITQEMLEAVFAQQMQSEIAPEQMDAEQGQDPMLMEMVAQDAAMAVESILMEEARHEELADLLLMMDPGLAARGSAGVKEARRAIKALAKGSEEGVEYVSSFTRTSRPNWETLMPFVDVFYPPETVMEDGLDSARWIARVQWMSAQQIREEAAIHGWDKGWVKTLLENHRGKPKAFQPYAQNLPEWALSGMGVRWTSAAGSLIGGEYGNGESQRNLYQIVRMWDRATTPDGLTAVYETVLHPDIADKVAKRDLLEHWDGMYPFFAVTCEMTEKLLLASRAIAELTKTPQEAIKAQWDSRTDMASLTTVPPWTGPAELKGTRIAPGRFIEVYRVGTVQAMQLPSPDGRSIEVERTLRGSVDRLFGRVSESVPQQTSMLRGQADMDWFLLAITRGVRLTARLIQQFMEPLTGARIMGTGESVNASREDVRGSFDYACAFDVRSLDLEWAKGMLEFINQQLMPLDRRSQINTGPIIEFGFNILHPSLAAVSVQPMEESSRREQEEERAAITEIFAGGSPPLTEGQDSQTREQIMVEEYQKSPMRQQMLLQNPQVRQVFTARLEHHVFQTNQYSENATTGRLGAADPLKVQRPSEQLLEYLKSVPTA